MTRYDPWSASGPAQHDVFGEMRRNDPVWRGIGPVTGRPIWFFTSYEDVVAVARDERIGLDSSRLPEHRQSEQPRDTPELEMLSQHMLAKDPPDHGRLRRLVSRTFGKRTVDELEPRITTIIQELLDGLDGATEIDLISGFALPLPLIVIAELLGIPPDDRDQFRGWVDTVIRQGLSDADDPNAVDRRMLAGMEFLAYLNEAIEEKRSHPADDLLSQLVHVEEDGDRLTHEELLSMIFLLLIAGHETTVNLIGNGVYQLTQHPDQLQLLRNMPDVIDTAIEEMLRFDGPVGSLSPRWAMEDLDWDGHRIEAGDVVVAILLSANRDPEVFDKPGRFDLRRSPNRHVGFGFGIHHCIGAPLARAEARLAIPALLDRYDSIDLAVEPTNVRWVDDWFLRGITELPLKVSPG